MFEKVVFAMRFMRLTVLFIRKLRRIRQFIKYRGLLKSAFAFLNSVRLPMSNL